MYEIFIGIDNPPISKDQATIAIEALRGLIIPMGANDSENNQIDSIIFQLNKEELTPMEAVASAQSILDNKNDYH